MENKDKKEAVRVMDKGNLDSTGEKYDAYIHRGGKGQTKKPELKDTMPFDCMGMTKDGIEAQYGRLINTDVIAEKKIKGKETMLLTFKNNKCMAIQGKLNAFYKNLQDEMTLSDLEELVGCQISVKEEARKIFGTSNDMYAGIVGFTHFLIYPEGHSVFKPDNYVILIDGKARVS